jgi:hypothetical protein
MGNSWANIVLSPGSSRILSVREVRIDFMLRLNMTFCIYHDFGISWCVQIYGKSRMFVHDGLGFYALSSDPDIEKHSDGKCWTPTIQYFRKMLHPDVSKYVRP